MHGAMWVDANRMSVPNFLHTALPPCRPAVALRRQGMWTPLINAANNGHLEVVRLLLEKGADPHFKDKVRPPRAILFIGHLWASGCRTPLVVAHTPDLLAFAPLFDVCGLLQNGNTALDWAKSENQDEVVALLKAQGPAAATAAVAAAKPTPESSPTLKNVDQDREEEEQIKIAGAAAPSWTHCFAKCVPGSAGS
jgi:ankyrin repeat protein